MPLLASFSNSRGVMPVRNAIILRLEHDGIEASAECVTDEVISCTGEDNATALRVMRDGLREALRGGGRLPRPEEFVAKTEGMKGDQMARAAVEMLLWDYRTKREDARSTRHSEGPAGTPRQASRSGWKGEKRSSWPGWEKRSARGTSGSRSRSTEGGRSRR